MLIKFNETYISINRSENTKGAYQFDSFQSPRRLTPREKFIMVPQSLLERFLPPLPTASSFHWLLLYVAEIETSIKLGLLHRTKECDMKNPRVDKTFGSHYTHPFVLKKFCPYEQSLLLFSRLVMFQQFVVSSPALFTFLSSLFICSYLHSVYFTTLDVSLCWSTQMQYVFRQVL